MSKLRTVSSSPHSDIYGAYLKEVGRRPLLTHEEEITLGRQVRAWLDADDPSPAVVAAGQRAKREMMERNLRLVCSVAKKYQNKGLEMLDLVQEGNLGLARAVEMYDPAKGYRFSTYSYWWIRQGMTRAIQNDSRTIRLPTHVHDTLQQAKKFAADYHVKHKRPPSPAEVAEYLMEKGKISGQQQGGKPSQKSLDIALAKFEELLQAAQPVASLDRKVAGLADEDSSSLGCFMVDPGLEPWEFAAVDDQRALAQALLEDLPPMYQRVMVLRYGLEDGQARTLADVGQELGVCRERARQIQNAAMRMLKSRVNADHADGIELIDLAS